jgi:hypothetical protein
MDNIIMDEPNFDGALNVEDLESFLSEIDSEPISVVESKPVKKDLKLKPISKSSVDKLYKTDSFNALELLSIGKDDEIPKLVDPFFQKVGLASLVGTSDAGKSMFLRHLSLCIVLGLDDFIGFKLNCSSRKVLYISTEDDHNSVSYTIKKQIVKMLNIDIELDLLKNLEFIFNSDNVLDEITKRVANTNYDLVVIDAFADVFTKEINANTQVRQFLNSFDKVAKKHNTLFVFLHHIGKRTNYGSANKDNIIGSQAFEAKMRAVVEIRPDLKDNYKKELWILKANFLPHSFKQKSFTLNLTDELVFENTGLRGNNFTDSKIKDSLIISKVSELHAAKKSLREIEKELKDTEFAIGKSSIALIVKNIKK